MYDPIYSRYIMLAYEIVMIPFINNYNNGMIKFII